MSQERAREFVQWLANNPDQRNNLFEGGPSERLAILEKSGFGDVNPQEVEQVLQAGAAGDISDEQLQSIQGGLRKAGITWEN
ncbi:putative Nif11-like leader peptide family natural product [Gammaproteobacteria bacterium]